ncbi:MAG: thioredoxin family protein, partial [Chloroflexota bacterium]
MHRVRPAGFLSAFWIAVCLALSLVGFAIASPAKAAGPDPVVYAVLFYSPTCGHCEKVINEELPPLLEKYGDQLQILKVNVTDELGGELYRKAKESRGLDSLGVPALFIGDDLLVGDIDIPASLPGIVESGLGTGGIDWPPIPDLDGYIRSGSGSIARPVSLAQVTETPPEDDSGIIAEEEDLDPLFLRRFK